LEHRNRATRYGYLGCPACYSRQYFRLEYSGVLAFLACDIEQIVTVPVLQLFDEVLPIRKWQDAWKSIIQTVLAAGLNKTSVKRGNAGSLLKFTFSAT